MLYHPYFGIRLAYNVCQRVNYVDRVYKCENSNLRKDFARRMSVLTVDVI